MMGNMSSDEKLAELRAAIDKADESLITVLGLRLELVREIGKLKREHKLEVRDEKRRAEVMQSRAKVAKKYNVSEQLINKLYESILNEAESIEEQ
jgi:chorismate mutase